MILLISLLAVKAGTGPDSATFISKTPCKLYLPLFGPQVAFSRNDLVKIAENFDLCYGHLPATGELDYIRQINPGFLALRYYGSWTHSCLKETHDLQRFERELRDAMLYYRAATLAGEVDSAQSRIRISDLVGGISAGSAHPDSTWSYHADGLVYYHTFLRVEEECMRIIALEGDSLRVERGFMGTRAKSHPAGAPLLSPLYNTNPNQPDAQSFAYHLDPRHPVRWEYLTGKCIGDMSSYGASGIYIDILGTNTLRATRMDGVITSTYWDRATDAVYSPADYRRASEAGVAAIQDSVCKVLGSYPVIWGNNMTAIRFMDGSHDRHKFLVATEEKPRPIDGYMIEDAWGGYSIEQWVDFDTNGSVVYPGKATNGTHNYRNWEMNLAELMVCADSGWAAAPQMINGGMKNYAFEFLTPVQQHDWFLWAYASFLLGIGMDEGGQSTVWQGITARSSGQGLRHITIDPCLQWKIGIPVPDSGRTGPDNYRITSQSYLRTFSNGVVLVNPGLSDDQTEIDLSDFGGPYTDPGSNREISRIRMPAQTGKILLREYDPDDYPGYPEAGKEAYGGNPYFGEPYRVPTPEPVAMPFFDRGEYSESAFDPDIQPEQHYMPHIRDDSLDSWPNVELTGNPAGIYRVTRGEYWRYSIRVEQAGLYQSRLHYGGSSSAPVERSISLSVFRPDSMQLVYSDTLHFDFGPGIATLPLFFTNIRLEERDYVLQWQGHYTGARPNLDSFTLHQVLSSGLPAEEHRIHTAPNPFSDRLMINGAEGGRARVYDMRGRLLIDRSLDGATAETDTRHLSPGSYVLRISNGGTEYRQVILKAK